MTVTDMSITNKCIIIHTFNLINIIILRMDVPFVGFFLSFFFFFGDKSAPQSVHCHYVTPKSPSSLLITSVASFSWTASSHTSFQ